MKLNNKSITEERAKWEAAGYDLPHYDRRAMIEATKLSPRWIHFGAGNIFRAYQANLSQQLLNRGLADTGLIVAEGFDSEIIERVYRPCDNLSILATLKVDGTVEKTVVGSIAESYLLDADDETQFAGLKDVFANPALQLATFTITEKGYAISNPQGEILPAVAADLSAGPAHPVSYIGKVVALLYERYLSGRLPIALVSTDNCSHNGEKLFTAVDTYAESWVRNGKVEAGFAEYVRNPAEVGFPWTMIDKITPRPDTSVLDLLTADGVEGLQPVVTARHTYVAPFVNAEECEYLVVEDQFPNGRPMLERVGVMFTDRDTVNRVERMKVCTCLNPLHTALALFGCVLGYQRISDEMNDPSLVRLVELIGYREGLPVVVDPSILNPREFIDTVLQVRVPNPFMPDTPQRIATDTSQKLSVRFGETVKAYAASPALSVDSLRFIPLVFAGWLRYLMSIDDEGRPFTLSPDPLLNEVRPYVSDIRLGQTEGVEQAVGPMLHNEKIFGVDLYKVGLAPRVIGYFESMISGPGAVRRTLEEAISGSES